MVQIRKFLCQLKVKFVVSGCFWDSFVRSVKPLEAEPPGRHSQALPGNEWRGLIPGIFKIPGIKFSLSLATLRRKFNDDGGGDVLLPIED
jgi:hypothetical protein